MHCIHTQREIGRRTRAMSGGCDGHWWSYTHFPPQKKIKIRKNSRPPPPPPSTPHRPPPRLPPMRAPPLRAPTPNPRLNSCGGGGLVALGVRDMQACMHLCTHQTQEMINYKHKIYTNDYSPPSLPLPLPLLTSVRLQPFTSTGRPRDGGRCFLPLVWLVVGG